MLIVSALVGRVNCFSLNDQPNPILYIDCIYPFANEPIQLDCIVYFFSFKFLLIQVYQLKQSELIDSENVCFGVWKNAHQVPCSSGTLPLLIILKHVYKKCN